MMKLSSLTIPWLVASSLLLPQCKQATSEQTISSREAHAQMLQTAKDRLAVATLWGDSLERRNVTDQLKKLDKTPPDSLEYNPAMDAYVLRTRYEDVFQLNTSSSAKK